LTLTVAAGILRESSHCRNTAGGVIPRCVINMKRQRRSHNTPAARPSAPVTRHGIWWVVAGVVALGLAGFEVYYYWPRSETARSARVASVPPSPRSKSPFLNTGPGVAYVGDQQCAGCHRDYVRTYQQHPMGQSLFTAADAPPLERYDRADKNPFSDGPFHFQAIRQGAEDDPPGVVPGCPGPCRRPV
jgi:hypothetical protein